jgi:hypothetical protein
MSGTLKFILYYEIILGFPDSWTQNKYKYSTKVQAEQICLKIKGYLILNEG